MDRRYRETHPWLSFEFDDSEFGLREWMTFGRAQADCEHLTGTPLLPKVADRLRRIYLSRGVQATVAIEYNTLTEEEVADMLDGPLGLPPSRLYLEQEVRNVMEAQASIRERVRTDGGPALTPEVICSYNESVLRGVDLDGEIQPGALRTGGIGWGRYLGPPAEDCPYLVERLCGWLDGDLLEAGAAGPPAFPEALTRALMAHLYLAWIRPFGRGNGRTARLVEYHLLASSGMVPAPATQLFSLHYNRTRSRYYQVLDRSSRIQPWSPLEFIGYALDGFVDGLAEQLEWIESEHLSMVWERYVNEEMRRHDTTAGRRQRLLATSLPPSRPTPRSEIRLLTPHLAAAYAGRTSKTVTRDLNRLIHLELLERTPDGVRPLVEKIEAFSHP